MKNIFLIGSSGFVGKHTYDLLVKKKIILQSVDIDDIKFNQKKVSLKGFQLMIMLF